MSFASNKGKVVTIDVLAREVALIIRRSPEIVDLLGKKLKVFLGADQQELPTNEDCPFAMVFFQNRNYGTQNGNQNNFRLVVQYGILSPNDSSDIVEDPDNEITVNETSQLSAQLGETIVSIIEEKSPCGMELAFGELDFYEDYYPIYLGELLLQFNTYKLIGSKQTIG